MTRLGLLACLAAGLFGCEGLSNLLGDVGVDGGSRDGGFDGDAQVGDGEVGDGEVGDAGADSGPDAAQADAACRLPPHESYTIDSTAIPPGEPTEYPLNGRRCRADIYLVDVPVQNPGIENLCQSLQAQLRADLGGGFLTDDDDGDGVSNGDAWFAVAPAPPLVQSFRPNGVLDQHCIVSFRRMGDRPSPIREEAQCDVVTTIRAALMSITNVAGDPVGPGLLVTRECDARTQGSPWFYDAVGIEPGSEEGGGGVTIAVVDTQVDCRAFPWAVGSDACDDPMSGPPAPRHGTAVGALVGNIAPDANVAFYAGLREPVGGPVTGVARAIHAALDEAAEDESLVINLSLGWPPEMGVASTLSGSVITRHTRAYLTTPAGPPQQCLIAEDPVGESTRRALYRASSRDTTAVVAAAGNRSTAHVPPDFTPDPRLVELIHEDALPKCTPGVITADLNQDLAFYPAAWGEPVSCVDATDAGVPLLIGVDQYAQFESPALDEPGRAALRAPGRRINSTIKVGDEEWSFLLTGTSAAAAIASGLTARLIADSGMSLAFADIRTLVLAASEDYLRDAAVTKRLTLADPPTDDWEAAEEERLGPACRDFARTYPNVAPVRERTPNEVEDPEPRWPDVYAVGTVSPQPIVGCTDDCMVLINEWDYGKEAHLYVTLSDVTDMFGELQLVMTSKTQEWRLPVGDKAYWINHLKEQVEIEFTLPDEADGEWETLDFRVEGYFVENNKVSTFISDDLPVFLE